MCKLNLWRTAITHIKAAPFLFYSVKLSLFSKGVAVYLLLPFHVKFKSDVRPGVFIKGLQNKECKLEAALSQRSAVWAGRSRDVTFLSKQTATTAFSFSNTTNLWNHTAVILEIKLTVHFISTGNRLKQETLHFCKFCKGNKNKYFHIDGDHYLKAAATFLTDDTA